MNTDVPASGCEAVVMSGRSDASGTGVIPMFSDMALIIRTERTGRWNRDIFVGFVP
jgi:hypothetical protein